MKLYIKQHVVSIRDSFEVRDNKNKKVFTVKSKLLSLPQKFTIYNRKGKKIATIRRQIFNIMPRYTIRIGTDRFVLKRKFSFFRHQYTVTNTNWTIKGDFFNHSYDIMQGSRSIMTLRKHWVSWGDSYELDIRDPQDAILTTSIVIALDAELARDKKKIKTSKEKD